MQDPAQSHSQTSKKKKKMKKKDDSAVSTPTSSTVPPKQGKGKIHFTATGRLQNAVNLQRKDPAESQTVRANAQSGFSWRRGRGGRGRGFRDVRGRGGGQR